MVTSRAVAPLHRLAAWCLPLVRPGGMMLAVKGVSAPAEVERDARAIAALGGGEPPDRNVRDRHRRSAEHGGRRGASAAKERVIVYVSEGACGASISADYRSDVSRETSPQPGWTPIAEEAARAARVLHPDRHRMPRPVRGAGSSPSPTRRAASARPRARSTSPPRSPCTACGCWSSTSTRRATPAPRSASSTASARRRSTRCCSARSPLAEAAVASTACPDLLLRARHDRPRGRRDRARQHGGPRARGSSRRWCRRRSTSSTSTTSSSTARPRSACSPSTRWSRRTRC